MAADIRFCRTIKVAIAGIWHDLKASGKIFWCQRLATGEDPSDLAQIMLLGRAALQKADQKRGHGAENRHVFFSQMFGQRSGEAHISVRHDYYGCTKVWRAEILVEGHVKDKMGQRRHFIFAGEPKRIVAVFHKGKRRAVVVHDALGRASRA